MPSLDPTYTPSPSTFLAGVELAADHAARHIIAREYPEALAQLRICEAYIDEVRRRLHEIAAAEVAS
jgi:hypothetical protein